MNKNILEIAKEKIEMISLKKKVSKLSVNEKESLNNVIDYSTSWWLSNIDLNEVNNNFKVKINGFKEMLEIEILKRILLSNEIVELRCDYYPEGILASCIKGSSCNFLEPYFPNKTTMMIAKEQVWLKYGQLGTFMM